MVTRFILDDPADQREALLRAQTESPLCR
jgi:hypothetical protein